MPGDEAVFHPRGLPDSRSAALLSSDEFSEKMDDRYEQKEQEPEHSNVQWKRDQSGKVLAVCENRLNRVYFQRAVAYPSDCFCGPRVIPIPTISRSEPKNRSKARKPSFHRSFRSKRPMISLAKTISRRCHLIPGQTRHVQLHAGEQSIGFGGRAADKRAIIRADLSTIDTVGEAQLSATAR